MKLHMVPAHSLSTVSLDHITPWLKSSHHNSRLGPAAGLWILVQSSLTRDERW